MHGQTQVRKPHGAAQPCRSSNPVRGWQKQAELLHPFLQNWITHPSFNLRDCHIYSSLFTSSPFQSQSMSPMYQSFLLSLIQFFCSQIRPQPTKIWVSKIFLAPLQPPSFQQEPAVQAGSEQPASSSPHLVVLSIGEKKKITDIQDLGANKVSWCYLGNITCWYPWQAYFFRYCSIHPLLHLGLSATPISTQREKIYHAEFLLLWIERESIQKRTFKERAFGITFPLSTRFYREIGYFEPLLVLCSVVICENYIKLSTQSDPNKNRTKCSIYNVLLQSSSATITVII